jgi:integrase/recombinase XerC
MNELIPSPVTAGIQAARPDAERLIEAFLAGRTPHTLRAYRRDLEDLARYLQVGGVAAIAGVMFGLGPGPANLHALGYRAHLAGRGLAPATVNRRLAALRSLVRMARVIGLIHWSLDVDSLPEERLRDTRGPGRDGVARMLGVLTQSRKDAKKTARDRAIVHLLFDLGLRRGEVAGLDVDDLEEGPPAVLWVLGKGKRQKAALTLPRPTLQALREWLAIMTAGPAARRPMFVSLDRCSHGHRLSGSAIWQIVRELGQAAGLGVVRPHGLRHAAITAGLDMTHGDVRAVQKFSRHADVRTLLTYDDNRQDLAGDVASRIAG